MYGMYSALNGEAQHLVPPLDLSKNLTGVAAGVSSALLDINRTDLSSAAKYCTGIQQDFGYNEGACCLIVRPNASIAGCTVVSLIEPMLSEDLQSWTSQLPQGIKVLDLSMLNLTGSLPRSFGESNTTLEVLNLINNSFTGPLPPEWGRLHKISVILLLSNSLASVELPREWYSPPSPDSSNLWSSLSFLYVDIAAVKQPLPWGWLKLDAETLVPINGSATGSPFHPGPFAAMENSGFEGHYVRPLDLMFNLSVLGDMSRSGDPLVLAASVCKHLQLYC
jgi:hypothetical protein